MRVLPLVLMLATAPLVAWVTFVPSGATDTVAASLPLETESRPPGCDFLSLSSRWSPAGGTYVHTSAYGYDKNAWLMGIEGWAVSPSGDLVLFDARQARVHVLDEGLRPKGQFGHAGGGPGELSLPPLTHGRNGGNNYSSRNHAAAGREVIYIYDGRSVKMFGYDGAYVGQHDVNKRGSLPGFTVLTLQATPTGLRYSYDDFDIHLRDRKLQTWTLNHSGRADLVHELILPAPPGRPGMVRAPSNQARPVWASAGECVVVGDGSSPWILRLDPRTGSGDSVRLPPHEVPEASEPDPYGDELRQLLRQGRGVDIGDAPQPTAVWHWAEMSIDPDGHVWLNPWRPRAARGGQIEVFRIDPAGTVHRETMPAFPLAFGPAGVVYSRGTDPDTEEVILVRFERRT